MIYDRLLRSVNLLRMPGVLACHIDEYEMERLHLLLEQIPIENAGTLVWDKGMPTTGEQGIATQHEYVLFWMKGDSNIRVAKKNIGLIHAKVRELLATFGAPTKEAISEYRRWLKSQTDFSKSEMTYDQFDETGRAFQSDNMSATDRRSHDKFYIPIAHPITGKPCPVPEYGWRYTPESMSKLLEDGLILFGEDESSMPRKKTYLEYTPSNQMPSIFRSGNRGKVVLDNLGLEFPFSHPIDFYMHIVGASSERSDLILDFFAGSGTTGHAVINLNREDGGSASSSWWRWPITSTPCSCRASKRSPSRRSGRTASPSAWPLPKKPSAARASSRSSAWNPTRTRSTT
jgi:adenine-specific DNA-methyltransferase